MGIPEEIRAVTRPKNTVIIHSGKNYAVRERLGCSYVDGRRVPVEGKIIGHITNGEYVPRDELPKIGFIGRVDLKDWGNVKLCDMLFSDILEDLCEFYCREDAIHIYVMAILRTCYPGVRDYQLQDKYFNSFLSEMYPDVPLSKNTVCTKLQNLGKECLRIMKFMRARVSRVSDDDTIVIDGSLKQDHSRINSLSQVSRKTFKTGTKQYLMLYAYSVNKREPICSKIYPGNMVDSRAILDFVKDNNIENGIIVADKGFPIEAITEAIAGRKGVHYLTPLERNNVDISENKMYEYNEILEGEGRISCKKKETENGVWLYSFRDPKIACEQEMLYVESQGEEVNMEELSMKRKEFGTLVFQSDIKMDCSKVYSIYDQRWLIELLFEFHKTNEDFDDTRVHSDYSVMATNFIDFLATLLGSRLVNHFHTIKSLDRFTYKNSMELLNRAKMVKNEDEEWEICRLPLKNADMLAEIGLFSKPLEIYNPQKRGRKKGSKDKTPRKRRTKKELREQNEAVTE